MARVIVYSLAPATAKLIGVVAPRGSEINTRDGKTYRSLASYPGDFEESATAYMVHVVNTASLTAAEQALLDAVVLDHVSAAAFQVTLTDAGVADYVATAAKLVDTSLRIANENRAPTVANALVNKTATQSVAFSYQFAANTFADLDGAGDTLTYSATLSSGSALPAWLTFTPSTRTFAGTPAGGDVGTITVRVKATDKAKAFVTGDFTITTS